MTLETWLASWLAPVALAPVALAPVALAIVPGPTVTVISANALRHGGRAGLMNVAGIQVGAAIRLAIAAPGLLALIAIMGVWFFAQRCAGGKGAASGGSICKGANRAGRVVRSMAGAGCQGLLFRAKRGDGHV